MTHRMPKVIVVGGSLTGLFAATMLRQAGCDVSVHERSEVPLKGRGAGIVVHDELFRALPFTGAQVSEVGIQLEERCALARDGRKVDAIPLKQTVSSWDFLYNVLRSEVPDPDYHLGAEFVSVEQSATSVNVKFANGEDVEGDLLIAADGFRSAIRAQILPQVVPEYAGYLVWRMAADERDLPPDMREFLFERSAIFLGRHTEAIGYPMPGLGNDLRPGHRRFNLVWYRLADQEHLERMLVGDDETNYQISVPPPRIKQQFIDEMKAEAHRVLPPQFVTVIEQSTRPFFTPIYDHVSPRMVFGRAALLGDAAAVGRPHIGMGATKGCGDAEGLVKALRGHDTLEMALGVFESERSEVARRAYLRGRQLGEYMHTDPENVPSSLQHEWEELHSIRGALMNTASTKFLYA